MGIFVPPFGPCADLMTLADMAADAEAGLADALNEPKQNSARLSRWHLLCKLSHRGKGAARDG
jgi:hypothetical protein